MDQRDFIAFWQEIHTIIDEALEKRDRSVSIYISPDSSISVNVEPWPNLEEFYDMYQEGKITLNDFRSKANLSMMRDEKDEVFEKTFDEMFNSKIGKED